MNAAAKTVVPARKLASKPVKMELNNSGSWKTVARFDAADEHQADPAMQAAELLHQVNPGYSWRIATDEPLPLVPMRPDDKAAQWRAAS